MVILIVMNSLLSNLGPRYSRRNSTTPIILGFLLLIIIIAVATYFIKRDDDDDDDDKDKKDENVPSIEDPTVTRTLLPDSSNSSESGTTETYEIGGGKTETYQVEYNNPITDITLSKNVKIGITWSNESGFENVYKLDIEHYVTPNNQDGSAGTPADDASFTKTITRYINGAKSGTKIADNENYFTKYAQNLTHEFQGDGTYSFVGTHTVKIIATYPDEDIEGADIDLDLTTGTATTKPVVVTSEDLAATLELTAPDVRVFTPIQGSFKLGQAVIQNQEYFASTGGVDIHKSINVNNNSSRPFTLIRASTTNSNEFYFKFSETEYLGHVDGALVIDTADSKKIITLVSSSLDNAEGTRYFRLSFVNDLYAIIDEDGNGAVKAMADIETEDVYDTLDWKLSLEPAISLEEIKVSESCEPLEFVLLKRDEQGNEQYLKYYEYGSIRGVNFKGDINDASTLKLIVSEYGGNPYYEFKVKGKERWISPDILDKEYNYYASRNRTTLSAWVSRFSGDWTSSHSLKCIKTGKETPVKEIESLLESIKEIRNE